MREMGADGFAFAVRVTCEVDGVGGLSCFAKLVDYFYLAGNHLVGGLEDIFGSDGDWLRRRFLWFGLRAGLGFRFAFLFAFAVLLAGQKNADRLRGKIHHVAVGGFYRVAPAQIFVDRFRLGGRFNDYE